MIINKGQDTIVTKVLSLTQPYLKRWLTDIIKYSNRTIRERNRQNTTELSTSEYL